MTKACDERVCVEIKQKSQLFKALSVFCFLKMITENEIKVNKKKTQFV